MHPVLGLPAYRTARRQRAALLRCAAAVRIVSRALCTLRMLPCRSALPCALHQK